MKESRPFHLLLKEIERANFLEFSRTPMWKGDQLSCDCSGLITLLLQRSNLKQSPLNELRENPRAFEYFDWLKGNSHIKESIEQIDRFDVLIWKKESPPQKGDTGHLLILLSRPKKVTDKVYSVNILEVNRFSGLCKRRIDIHTEIDGRLLGVAWHPESSKVKRTEILAVSLFKPSTCSQCNEVNELCLCQDFPKEKPAAPPFVILRHPLEKRHPLGTIPLLQSFYQGLKVLEGEVFDPIEGLLIYPQVKSSQSASDEKLKTISKDHPLILIDASWKKSVKILELNPWLKKLPRFEISEQESLYFLRKQRGPNDLSTIESFAYCLKELIPHRDYEATALIRIFKSFIEKRTAYYDPQVLEEFYQGRLGPSQEDL